VQVQGLRCQGGSGVPGREWGAREGVGCKLGIEVPGREWGAREGVGCQGESGVQVRD